MRSPGPSCGSSRLPVWGGIGRDVAQGGFEERLVTPAPGRADMFGAPVEKVRDVSWPEASAGSGASRTGAMPACRSERSQIRTEIIRPNILELAAPQRRLADLQGLLKALELERVLGLALLEEAQPVADHLAGVLVPPLRDAAFDEVVEVIRQVDVAGRHCAPLELRRETGKNWQRRA